jgi:hypothetical protein
MQLSAVYKTLYDFVVWAANSPELTVVQAYQSSNPRASKPFIIINISGYRTYGTPMYYDIDNEGIREVGLNKVFTVTFNAFSDDLHQSEQLLNDVKDRLHTNYATVNFFKYDIAPRVVTLGVNSLPKAISNSNESRAILEVTFGSTDIILDDVGLIEHVVITDIDGSEIIVNK